MCMLLCMCMLNVRAQILFDEVLWGILHRLSKTKKTSISSLVRQAVRKTYLKTEDLESRRKAIEEIERIRPHFKGKLDYKEMINYGRKY